MVCFKFTVYMLFIHHTRHCKQMVASGFSALYYFFNSNALSVPQYISVYMFRNVSGL